MLTRFFTRRNTLLLSLISILLLAMLAACAPASPQVAQPSSTPAQPEPPAEEPTQAPAAGEDGPFTVAFLEQFKPDQVLIQLADEPTFTLPEWRFEFGRVPPFTLLADGRLIYLDENADFTVMVAQLTPEQTVAMLNQVHAMGFNKLEDYTDMCMKDENGQDMCIADASYYLLRARTEDKALREVRGYANFSNEPKIYEAISALLREFDDTQAVQYVPKGATLFIRPMADAGGATPMEFPLHPGILKQSESKPDGFLAMALNEEQVKAYLSKLTRIGGQEVFEWEGKFFSGRLVPWLPGVDYTEEIRANMP